MSRAHNLQDPFLNILRNNVNQMVYKHAVSTIVPARAVQLPRFNPENDEKEENSEE